jgi:hypothetical protein
MASLVLVHPIELLPLPSLLLKEKGGNTEYFSFNLSALSFLQTRHLHLWSNLLHQSLQYISRSAFDESCCTVVYHVCVQRTGAVSCAIRFFLITDISTEGSAFTF